MQNSSNVSGGSEGSTMLSSTISSLGTSKSLKSTSSSVHGSPSFARRRRAVKEVDETTAHQLCVVDCYRSKYLAIAEKLFGYFEEVFESLRLDDVQLCTCIQYEYPIDKY
mmetsp:Transcript_62991/g.70425  ORF Transcript_62991/g.70425 Transcript_62991/m.70425 type:complete len:110 (+) Transcript_62991:66-395(+)